MRIAIAGAGPAGLHLAALLRTRRPGAEIRLVEQNKEGATFGFGVVFSDRALDFLAADDPDLHAALTARLESWQAITLNHPGGQVVIDGIGFTAIARLDLLRLLTERCRALGVEPEFNTAIRGPEAFADCDLIVAADGVNSTLRNSGKFGTEIRELTNRFAWFGTTRRFDTLTQTFRRTPLGAFNAHHYRYAPGMSTFIVECDAATFASAGFATMHPDRTRALLEQVFAPELDGHGLVSNRSVWRRFPVLRNARWHDGNVVRERAARTVLIGDALRTAHFSIGSGTRLALEDSIALAKALDAHWGDIPAALAAFEAARRPVVDALTEAADASAAWYEEFARHMALAPIDFALSYIQRSGRVKLDRLARIAPEFVARVRAERPELAA
ncbi:MAG TPA: FAD-dependent monooxygenase [Falsiroseomonas sp.]|jgi:2-polyprenyl-6-methoxyphenol hydroxylase-like FAD-dependent oxidoreductase|nr:FAD-dependent monooxygenase [Falsiroseomonas sp.]